MDLSGFDVDYDLNPDLLISLLGKLSLDNIPCDVTETLQGLENKNYELACSEACFSGTSTYLPTHGSSPSTSTFENSVNCTVSYKLESCTESIPVSTDLVSRRSEESTFSTSIPISTDLVTTCTEEYTDFSTESRCSDSEIIYSSEKLNTLEKSSVESSQVVSKKSKKKSKHRKKPKEQPDNEDKVESKAKTFTFLPADLSAGNNPFFPNIFAHQKNVYNIQLSDVNNLTTLPFLFSDDITVEGPLATSQETNSSESFDSVYEKSSDTSSVKSVCSPDSGYDTSSAVSPTFSSAGAETSSSALDFLDDSDDEELDSLIAAIIEYESLVNVDEDSLSNSQIPVLKDTIDAAAHMERIMNFLKEPQVTESEKESKDDRVFKFTHKGNDNPDADPGSQSRKFKRHLSDEDWKLQSTTKFARTEVPSSSFLCKGRRIDKSKILKQLQENQQKKQRVMQLINKKLKRKAAEDRENKKRRIQV